MKRKLLLFILVLCTFFVQQNLKAQATVLAPGDIAFIGYQAGTSTDGFSFITLKDINAGTLVYFTECGWGNGAWIPSNPETHLLWTVPAFTPAGKVVSIVESSADTFTVTGSSGITLALNTGFNLANSGDQILAYQSSTGPQPASPTFIAGVHADYNSSNYDPLTTWNTAAGAAAGGASESSLPPGLVNGETCISLFPAPGPEQNNSKYTGTLTGTVADLLSKINNPSATYWSHSAGAADLGIIPTSYPTPAVSTVVVATVSTTGATSVKAVSAVLGGNLSITGGDATVQRGIVWATTAAPTIANNKVQNGTGIGTFSATITGLPSATLIYYRAYSTNSAGTSYGAELTFTTGAGLATSATSQVDILCHGANTGSASVTATGGTPTYTYAWSPSGGTGSSASSLTAGTYTVTITDTEATQITRNFTISEPAVLNGTPSTTAVACFGGNTGTATVIPTGGSGGYTYAWSSGATTQTASNLIAGTYSVTITDSNSCTKTITGITVAGPTAALGGTASTTPVSCFNGTNGTATATPTGGTGAKTYLWSNGATGATATALAAGTYIVTITDANACTFTITGIVVGGPTAAVDGTASTTPVSCFGGTNGTAVVVATGGTPNYTYSWSPTGGTAALATGLTAGTYSVLITDSKGCTKTVSGIVVGGPAANLSGITSTTPVSCFGGSNGTATVAASGGTPNYTYLWAPGGQTGATASGLTTGTYSVTITDANACTFTINNISVGTSTVINPNPTQVNVSCNGGANGSATVAPTGGAGSYTYLWSNGATSATIANLAQGTYSVTITDANACPISQSFTITEPPVLAASVGASTNPSCYNGSNGLATVAVTGGTLPYTYSWSPSGGTAATASGLEDGTYIVTVTDAKGCTATQSFTLVEPTPIVLTDTQTNILCHGDAVGIAGVTATGGTGAYTYSWSPTGGTAATATGLIAGTYTVTVTDANSCQATKAITITEPLDALTTSQGTVTNVDCFGEATGSATVIASGGTGSYSYSWSPSGGTGATASALTAGSYTVTVTDDNGCTTSQGFTIAGPGAALSATTSSTPVSCFSGANGTASVNVSGGTPNYTYSWSPSGGTADTATGLTAGDYTVTITDSKGCTLAKTITVGTPTEITGTISKVDVSCNGGSNGSATVTASGGVGGYSYTWAPSGGNAATASGLTEGNYTVTIQDANTCIKTIPVTIGEPTVLTAGISKTDVSCYSGTDGTATVTATGGTGTYSYVWSPSGGTNAIASGLLTGNYSCLITDANGCSVTASTVIFQPAPLDATTSQINATCSIGGQATVTPYGGVGSYTYSWSPSGQTTATAVGLTAGNHFCTINDGNNCTVTKNFFITTTNTLVAATSQTDILCNGANTGEASVVPSGAPGPFTYVWAPSGGNADTASNLTAGNYSVTITSANGCSIVKNFTITEPAALIVTPSQIDLLCNGATTGEASVSVTGGTGAYTYAWSPSGGTAATATGLTAGTYTVTITDANLCQATQAFTITEPSAFTATIAPTNVSCNGGTTGAATVTATGGTGAYTYAWSPSGGTAATATGLTAGTYTVTVTDANSCTTTQSVTLTEPATLVASVGGLTDVTCNGLNNGSATVNVTGGTGTYTYAWSPSGGNADTATGLSPGTYTVTVTDANSCAATQSFTITEPTVLTTSITGQTDVTCNGGTTGDATVTATGGTGAYTYSWSPSGGTAATATGLTAGTYSVTVTDANNCTSTQSVTITEPTALTATIAPTNVSCNGGTTGAATVTATGGTGTYTYVWSPFGGTAATATGLTAGTYTVTVTDANACTTTQIVTLTEPATLVASVGSQNDVTCNGLNNGSATVNVTGGTGTYTYSWLPSGGTADTATGLSPGTYTVIVTDANSCTATQSFTITEPTVLTASITGQADVTCNGQANGSATVTVNGGSGTYTYLWSPSGGNAATATGLSGGTYTVTVTDANSCTTTQSVTITEPNALTATIAPINVSCNGGTTGAATVTATGGTGTYTYAWLPSGGTAATATGLTAGTYTVTVTDANSCTTTQSVTLTEPAPLVASVGSQNDVTCNGLNNGSATVNVTGGTGTYTYAWTPSGGTAATATGLSPGTYTVIVTDANSCAATQSFTITEPTVLTASITAQADVTCNGQANGSATVTANGGAGTYTYLWSPSGGNAATATGLSGGTYTVTVTDANSCTTTQSVTITEPNALTATIAPTNVSCNGGTTGAATVTATGGTGTYTYAWLPSGGTAATATGLTAGTYTVTVTDANSCTTTQSVTLTEPTLLTASIATPTNVSCNGGSNGSATVTATGGTGTYTYFWSPTGGNAATATGLVAGVYTVTVTDTNSCTTTQSVVITEPVILAAITTQTNVTCSGANDGSATVIATGGTVNYTYAWSPSGGTADTATGLSAGNYTVTVTDAKGCTVTKSISILTTPDVTAPVPNVATLPIITSSCSVVSTQIPVPTATDNCSGIITGTTTNPLTYNTVGTYVITWSYDDGHGNISTQNQTVNVTASPLDLVTFSDTEFTYNGSLNTLQVGNLPAGASVTYAITPATGTANSATNAGVYSITATVTPSASTPNCSPITLTAQLTIKKAAQQITFGALPIKVLGGTNTFNLAAIANSGLAVRYTFTSPTALPAANVATNGVVNLLRPGTIVITAHQDGDGNYLPAPDVSQVLIVKNNDITIAKITIGNQVFLTPAKNANIKYVMLCDENNPSVSILNETNATIFPSANFNINTPKPGIYTQTITVTSEDGSTTSNYTITVEKPFGFFDIVHQKFNNVLLVNNNPLTNGGYEFASYEWYKNGLLIGTGQYYTAGNALGTTLDPTADYSVKMTTKDGKVLQTCKSKISLSKSSEAKLYPNPIQVGKTITVEADFPVEELANMQISLYSVSGQLIKTVKSSTIQTEIELPQAESSMYIVVVETANIKKTLKVIVKK